MGGHKRSQDVIKPGTEDGGIMHTMANFAGPVGAAHASDLAVLRFGFVALARPPDGASVPDMGLPFGGALPRVTVLIEKLGVS